MTYTPDFVLTPEQYEALWSDLGLGSHPYPLDVRSSGRTAEERARVRETSLAELKHVRRDVEPLLRLLNDHQVAVDLVADADGPVRALAASSGRFAVLAVVGFRGVELTAIRSTGLSAALLDVLPHQDAGHGHALSVPFEALHKAAALVEQEEDEDDHPWGGGTEYDERTAFVKAGLSQQDASLLSELTTTRTAGGQFGVSYADRGTRGRAPIVVTWFDTPRGRYLMVKDGAWLSIAPADRARMIARIDSVLSRSAAA